MKNKTIKSNCKHFRVCKSTKKGTWCDCSLGKGLICNTEAEYCKFEPQKKTESNTMTKNTNEVIIDGVDVSGCRYIHNKHETCALHHHNLECRITPDCYFKQLQRLKKENEELKTVINKAKNSPITLESFFVGEYYEKEIEKYVKCLKEIKEYCQEETSKLDWTASNILQKIEEALNETNKNTNDNR